MSLKIKYNLKGLGPYQDLVYRILLQSGKEGLTCATILRLKNIVIDPQGWKDPITRAALSQTWSVLKSLERRQLIKRKGSKYWVVL